jgi:hypothetical protein
MSGNCGLKLYKGITWSEENHLIPVSTGCDIQKDVYNQRDAKVSSRSTP